MTTNTNGFRNKTNTKTNFLFATYRQALCVILVLNPLKEWKT